MSKYQFSTGDKLLELCNIDNLKISDITLKREISLTNLSQQEQMRLMNETFLVMKDSVTKGINSTEPSTGGLIGENSVKMYKYFLSGKGVASNALMKAITYALAITEENARMGKIVACPTAGACGVVPSLLISLQEELNLTNQEIVKALFNASAVGIIIATNASISGAEGGCQAEVGSASAMAASAMVELLGGTPEMCLNAASIALKNTLGLVCDPVAGLVEVPCSKRNTMGVSNAFCAAHMSLAGITSFIKFDEVVEAMNMVGKSLPSTLKETALGGLAITQTARDYVEKILD